MKDISERAEAAREDPAALDRLLEEEEPFILRQVTAVAGVKAANDLLSVGMLAFVGAVRGYNSDRGDFPAYAGVCIRSRVLDVLRREAREAGRAIPLYGEGEMNPAEARVSLLRYNVEQERAALREEIAALDMALMAHGLTFAELSRVSPRHDSAKRRCVRLARHVLATKALREALDRTGRLPQGALALAFGLSPKTIEKHRRYIVALTVLLRGDFPMIQAFLRIRGEKDA